jgi:uncharacterized protein
MSLSRQEVKEAQVASSSEPSSKLRRHLGGCDGGGTSDIVPSTTCLQSIHEPWVRIEISGATSPFTQASRKHFFSMPRRHFMKHRLIFLLALGFLSSPVWSADAAPGDASIHQLLEVMQAQKLVDSMTGQLNGMMLKSAEQANGGAPLGADEQKIVERGVGKLSDLIKQQMSWPQLEPMMIDIYRKSFSQKEVDDLLVFYRSPSGQAVIQKMPVVMQQSMAASQAKMQAIVPQMRQIDADMVKELKTYRDAHPSPSKQ